MGNSKLVMKANSIIFILLVLSITYVSAGHSGITWAEYHEEMALDYQQKGFVVLATEEFENAAKYYAHDGNHIKKNEMYTMAASIYEEQAREFLSGGHHREAAHYLVYAAQDYEKANNHVKANRLYGLASTEWIYTAGEYKDAGRDEEADICLKEALKCNEKVEHFLRVLTVTEENRSVE